MSGAGYFSRVVNGYFRKYPCNTPLAMKTDATMINTYTKTCPECGAMIHGRADKKFCSDQCRSSHRNQMRDESRFLMRRVNHVLKMNRRILDELLESGQKQLTIDHLIHRGFDFSYFTNIRSTADGLTFFCYDRGFKHDGRQPYISLVRME